MQDFNSYLPVVGFLSGIFAAVWGAWRRVEKNQHDALVRGVRMEDRLNRIEQQFGPNGGGLRQAVNEISHKLNTIEDRQVEIIQNVAKLTGEFEQHIKEKE